MLSYVRVLAVPGAAAFCGAGALARLPQGMIGLGSVLMLSGLGRSYTLAGLVAGAIAMSQSVVAPQISRLADHRGQARVLVPQLAVHVAALGALVAATEASGPGPLLVALAVAAGGSLPQIGAFARARGAGSASVNMSSKSSRLRRLVGVLVRRTLARSA